ncbi:MAG: hypothetical protein MPW17_22770 (plasmid) [Candidatus Manganitrophus sp.]|nr:hypothetical protein [Candidatus Manganitrophus sp.]WDT73455.1 MAG: hypothetical protein MPW17_22770 [Candidatus Manganitrophus sp.]WDT77916.1 MAG: hypothetical protein MPW16_21205 [Candidatus Manganitrophus sp.]
MFPVVIGIEVDNIGNFSSAPAESVTREAIGAEIARLRALGVRYVFPIHTDEQSLRRRRGL